MMKNKFKNEVLKLKDKIDKNLLEFFLKRTEEGNLIKEENPFEHFGSFFLPIDAKERLIFLGHHIRANGWIPPGGHIKKGENPLDTVFREFKEELDYELTNERINLFDLSAESIRKTKGRKCKFHYSFWYLVYIDKTDFNFDRNEFHSAKWVTLEEGIKLIQRKKHKEIIKKLKDVL